MYSLLLPSLPSVQQQNGGVERCVLIFSCENSKIATHCWTTINRRMLEPTKNDTSWPRTKWKSQQDGRRREIALRIKPHTNQRGLEGSDKTLCIPGPRDPTETEPEQPLSVCLLQRHGSAVACRRDRVSGYSKPGSHRVTYHRAAKQKIHKLENNNTKEILAQLRKF